MLLKETYPYILPIFKRHFACIFTGVALLLACKQESKPVVSIHNMRNESGDSLVKLAEKYIYTRPDSLSIIAGQLQRLGKRLGNDQLIVKGERYKARSSWNLGSHAEGMQEAMTALSHAEKLDVKSEIPEIYAVIGNLHKEKANYEMALEAADKGLVVARELHDTASIIYMKRMKAMFTQGLGADRKDTTLILKSLRMHLQGLKLAEISQKFEPNRIAYYNNIAQAYVKFGELEKASYYVNKAIKLAIKYNQQFSLTYSYAWLSQIYGKRGDRQNAVKYMQMALDISKSLKYSFREMEINLHLTNILKQFGDYEGALQTYSRYSKLRDSLRVLENVRQLGDLQLKYDTEKKDKTISALGSQNKDLVRQTTEVWSVLGLIILLLIGILYQFRINVKRNKSLARQNLFINAQAEKMQTLMKELHHRVKNNLQIVSNLLSLQVSRVSDEESRNVIRAGQQRIEAMSLIHRSLYNDQEVNKVNMNEYLSELINSIMQSFGMDHHRLQLTIICEVEELDIDIALPLGLIINEWVTNAFKHAYEDVGSPILTLILKGGEMMRLEISDNGRGIDLSLWDKPKGSFGVKLVKVLVRQLNGECRVYLDSGTKFELKIPVRQLEIS